MGNYKEKPRPFSSHEILTDWVQGGSSVLDVGCGTGYFASRLKEKGCAVLGIDSDAGHVERARQRGIRSELVDLHQREQLRKVLDGCMFDYVVCTDVLEHIEQPSLLLRELRGFIAGRLLVSIPNVAHWSVRWQLLRGRWRYADSGILDRTHVQFFTRETAKELLHKSGYTIWREGCTPHPALIPPQLREKTWPHASNYAIAHLRPSLLAMQFLSETSP